MKSLEKNLNLHEHKLLQLAKRLCGAVARSYRTEHAARYDYRKQIIGKEWGVSEITLAHKIPANLARKEHARRWAAVWVAGIAASFL